MTGGGADKTKTLDKRQSRAPSRRCNLGDPVSSRAVAVEPGAHKAAGGREVAGYGPIPYE
jgi:hypothetical protein